MGSSTQKDLHALCYQHHKEMVVGSQSSVSGPIIYACQKPDCLVRYEIVQGYFLDTTDPRTLEQEIRPKVSCSKDRQPMYLAEVQPQKTSFRLWKCPRCGATCTNEESSNGLEKKMGA